MAVRRTFPPGGMTATGMSQRQSWTSKRLAAPAITLIAVAGFVAIYWLYLHTSDISPDSLAGYGFAIAGTVLMALVGVGYVARKRLRRHSMGLLHGALRWHIAGGALALLLILMHAAGNFHPRTGTYALYALVALVISGIVGKWLDRIAPQRAAKTALKTLTQDGEDRLESLIGTLQPARSNRHAGRTARPSLREMDPASSSWDLAYHDLRMAPSAIPETFASVPAVMPSATRASESDSIRRAMDVERFYLLLIRVWRQLHTALSVVTLGLILWHLEFAATLLMQSH